jgi:hypothetical protein
MATVMSLLVAFGLLAFGLVLMFFSGAADDPYRHRKFSLGKGVSVRMVFGAVALLMGAVQLYLWFGGRL